MPIKTTCIGAFPKPEYVPIKDWFKVIPTDENYNSAVVGSWSDDPAHEPFLPAPPVRRSRPRSRPVLISRPTASSAARIMCIRRAAVCPQTR